VERQWAGHCPAPTKADGSGKRVGSPGVEVFLGDRQAEQVGRPAPNRIRTQQTRTEQGSDGLSVRVRRPAPNSVPGSFGGAELRGSCAAQSKDTLRGKLLPENVLRLRASQRAFSPPRRTK